MTRTYLDNIISDSLDFKTISVLDTSTYNEDIETEDPYLEVTPPNFDCPVLLAYVPGEINVINSTVLGWTASSSYMTLADGIWTFKQSVCPNDKIFLEKKHLRILITKSRILQEVIDSMESCNTCDNYSKWWKMLQDLELAKYMVEHCEEEKGVILFNAIVKQLSSCPTC
jgi:hypothetical protein